MEKELKTSEALIGKIGEVKHYADGHYILETPDVGHSGSIYLFENLISARFNQLKAKLFNLAETSASNEIQLKAMKGLIRDFSNDMYRATVNDITYLFRQMGFHVNEWTIDKQLEEGKLTKIE